MHDAWERGAEDEVRYWHDWLASQGVAYAHDSVAAHREFRERFDPDMPLQQLYRDLIGAPKGAVVRILDVGAGPATTVGKVWPGRELNVVAIDPLGARYHVWLRHYELFPPVRTQPMKGEDLWAYVGWHGEFDLTHMHNALDHSADPVAIVRGMLACTKPGGVVYLRHHSNEATREQFSGLHQWNFYECGGSMWMQTPGGDAIDLRAETSDLAASFDLRFLPHPYLGQSDDIEVVMRRATENWHSRVLPTSGEPEQ